MRRTTLGRTKVLARSGGAGAGATSLLNGESAALELLTLQGLLGSIGLLRGHEVDEAEATGLLGVWVAHDLALLDIAVLGEEASNLLLDELGVNASDEQVGASVAGTLAVVSGAGVVLPLQGAAGGKRLLEACCAARLCYG